MEKFKARQFDKSILTVQKEQKLIKEMSDYYTQHEYNPNDEKMKHELEEYLYKIFELNVNEIGYMPKLLEGDSEQIDFEKEDIISLQFFDDKDNMLVGDAGISKAQTIDTSGKVRFGSIPIRINIGQAKGGDSFDIAKLIMGVYHELNHARQLIMVREGVCSKETLAYAKEFALFQAGKIDFYKQNYNRLIIESESLMDLDITEIGLRNIFGGIRNSNYYKLRGNSINPIFREEVSNELEQCITADLIKMYPILQKEYNMDGTKKTAMQLVTNLKAELDKISSNQDLDEYSKRYAVRDCKEMYYELIIDAMDRESLSFAKRDELDDQYSEYGNLSLDIQNYFESQIKKISEAQLSLSSQEKNKIIKYYERKIDLLKDEWSFGVTEEDQQKAQERMKILKQDKSDYHNPKQRPIKFDWGSNPNKWTMDVDGIYRMINCSDITLSEYNDEIKKVKSQAQVMDNKITRGEEQERH